MKLPVGPEASSNDRGREVSHLLRVPCRVLQPPEGAPQCRSGTAPGGYSIEFSGNFNGDPGLTARKGPQWILVTTGSDRYWVDTVKEAEMAQDMQATAEMMANDISATGHFAVYGIYFDTDKSEIKPESEPALDEMAKLLKSKPALNVFIVGHTDNTGTFEHNLKLSLDVQPRWSTRWPASMDCGGASQALGVASLAPVASNTTEDGRAKNRRVELVER